MLVTVPLGRSRFQRGCQSSHSNFTNSFGSVADERLALNPTAGPVGTFLELPIFSITSRLSFGAYLFRECMQFRLHKQIDMFSAFSAAGVKGKASTV